MKAIHNGEEVLFYTLTTEQRDSDLETFRNLQRDIIRDHP